MYEFRRLPALLVALSVTQPARRQVVFRWLRIILWCAFAVSVALAQIFTTSHDWPISWEDIAAHHVVARSFLLSSYVAFATGIFTITAIVYGYTGYSSRINPSSDIVQALREAARSRDPRVAPVAQMDRPVMGATSDDTVSNSETELAVASLEPLVDPLSQALLALAIGVLAFWFAAFFVSNIIPQDMINSVIYGINASDIYNTVRFVGSFVAMGVVACIFAWRTWNGWRAKSRGATVIPSPEGLTIYGRETLWRGRFIPWSGAESLVRFSYSDTPDSATNAYLLDAGNQTFLWESPNAIEHTSPSYRAKVVEWQTSAERLMTLAASATGLPLLDVSKLVNAIVTVEPGKERTGLTSGGSDDAIGAYLKAAETGQGDTTNMLMRESERKKVVRALTIMIVVCAIVIALLWAV